ncbi:MAG: RNA polymerase sigma factor [Actinobacteria bacterium]|nr:RNA polymerase sigma factor [Actinomycetota bacterium]
MDFTMPAADRPIELVVDDLEVLVSFEDFYRTERSSIGRALAVTLRDPVLASEAIDEAMARAYQHWGRVAQLDNPGGWVYRVGLNWSRSVVRRLVRPAPIWMTGPDSIPAPTIADPAIDRALEHLTVDQRAVVVCRLLLNLSEAQTADALGIKPGTVKSRLHRALERLAPLLTPLQEDS